MKIRKNRIFYRITVLCAAAVLLALSGTAPCKVYAKADSAKKTSHAKKEEILIQIGKKKKAVKVLKGSFEKKKGIRYFRKQNGKRAKNQFFAKGEHVYYVNSKGEVSLGWEKIKGHYYFFDRKSGKLSRNTEADSIKITNDGIARESKRNVERIKAYLDAQKVVETVSKPTDSKSKKLYKAYLWMKKFPYRQYRSMKAAKRKNPKDWEVVFANDIFKKHKGCCASESCAFAFIAKVCGYENVTICSDGRKLEHVWVDIGGRLYDPLFAEARGFKKNYNAKYTDYRKHPKHTKKL